MPNEDWWGYSQKHGWVVLDRNNPANRTDASKYQQMTFVRCDDWTEFTELKIKWNVPHFLFAPVYITRLRGVAVRDAKSHLESLQKEWPSQKRRLDEERRQAIYRARRNRDDAARQARAEEQGAIKEFVLSREIGTLIHFTRVENLDSILNNGLLPRSMAQELGLDILTTDVLRLDHKLDAVNLSISFPNYKMFCAKQYNDTSKDWAILCLKPNVLWEHECSFYSGNAAGTSSRDKVTGQPLQDLRDMFAEETVNCRGEPIMRSQLGIPNSYTTDPQAEVLACGRIDTNYIFGICFKSSRLKSVWEQQLAHRRSSIKAYQYPEYFNARVDFRYWPRKTGANY